MWDKNTIDQRQWYMIVWDKKYNWPVTKKYYFVRWEIQLFTDKEMLLCEIRILLINNMIFDCVRWKIQLASNKEILLCEMRNTIVVLYLAIITGDRAQNQISKNIKNITRASSFQTGDQQGLTGRVFQSWLQKITTKVHKAWKSKGCCVPIERFNVCKISSNRQNFVSSF